MMVGCSVAAVYLDGGSLADGEADCRLGGDERREAAVRPADGEQHAARDAVRVPVDKVVEGVAAQHLPHPVARGGEQGAGGVPSERVESHGYTR
jgi:hypothetical protein